MFADGNGNHGKEMTDKLLCRRHELITDHSHLAASSVQFSQCFQNPFVGTGSIEGVFQIIIAESLKGSVELRISGSIRYGTFH